MRKFPTVCACVLAAGESRRMGACKLLMPFAGTTLLDRAVDAACGCAAQEAVVVTGAFHDEMADRLAARRVHTLRNPLWSRGQASSVKTAVRYAESAGYDAVLLMVADQPHIDASHLNALLSEYDRGTCFAYLAATENRNGNPCLFDRRAFAALLELEGDEGARALFRAHRDIPARYVHFDDPRIFDDVDTPRDLVRIEEAIVGDR